MTEFTRFMAKRKTWSENPSSMLEQGTSSENKMAESNIEAGTSSSVDISGKAPDVFRVSWLPDDHVAELTRILHVETCLVQYVEESIEPAGWRAIWRPSSDHSELVFNFKQPVDVFVDVVNVSREELLADVEIVKPVKNDLPEDDVKLLQQQKNEQDIEMGHIPSAAGTEIRNLVKQASIVENEIKMIESFNEGEEVDQVDVTRLIQLHKQMEQLKARYEILQDPMTFVVQYFFVRELSNYEQQIERCRMVSLKAGARIAKLKVVVDSLPIGELALHMAKLPDLIKCLPQFHDDEPCETYPSLQLALDMTKKEDVVVVLPGIHLLSHLRQISEGGMLIGLGDGVVIQGMEEAGDILMDTSGTFSLQNITVRPASNQVAVLHHEGILTLNNVTFEGGSGSFVGLGKTNTQVDGVIARGCSGIGMDFREGATAVISGASVYDCGIGIQLKEEAKVSLSTSTITNNKKHGVLFVWPVSSDISKFNDIPKEALLECLLQEYMGSSVEYNAEDVGVVVAESVSMDNDPPSPSLSDESRPRSSTDSMDSGCEFIENIGG
ncbi:SHC SH2 domain-binding protein 1 B-like [Homarus americanus]|uniref:SHC SH2 domain-binding protein 1 B-like n=1 Tax=Homarus americanus TaxID=6706 RepID=A0A8J5JJY5_HOMAM|nr:SHC SH2 domain-binding protein 1 B-like [Homarus americanus]